MSKIGDKVSFTELMTNEEYKKEGYVFYTTRTNHYYKWSSGVFGSRYLVANGTFSCATIYADMVSAMYEVVEVPKQKFLLVKETTIRPLYWVKGQEWTPIAQKATKFSQEEKEKLEKEGPFAKSWYFKPIQ